MLIDLKIDDKGVYDNYLTEFREINRVQIVTILNNQSTLYTITRENIFDKLQEQSNLSVFTFDDCYLSNIF